MLRQRRCSERFFRNIFGWSATRSSVLPSGIYDKLYEVYVQDRENLGIEEYFERTNPAALQEMTATMLESARKGFWDPSEEQLEQVASLNARITENMERLVRNLYAVIRNCKTSSLQILTAKLPNALWRILPAQQLCLLMQKS